MQLLHTWGQSDNMSLINWAQHVLLEDFKCPPDLCARIKTHSYGRRRMEATMQPKELSSLYSATEDPKAKIWRAIEEMKASEQDAYLNTLEIGMCCGQQKIGFDVV